MIHGEWKTVTIANNATESDLVDLGRHYEWAVIDVPTIDTATLTVMSLSLYGRTVRPVYTTDPADGNNTKIISASGEGNFLWIVPLGSLQWIRLRSNAAQSPARTFYICGARS